MTDLGRANRARRLDQRLEAGQLVDDRGVGDAGAEEDVAILLAVGRQLRCPRQVDDGRRPKPAEVELDHQVRSARERDGFRPLGFHGQGLLERARQEHIHG